MSETKPNTSAPSQWLAGYPTPWHVEAGLVSHTVSDVNGCPICCLPPFEWNRPGPLTEQARAAALIAYAPDLLTCFVRLLDVMRRTDRELTQSLEVPLATDDEWDDVIEDAMILIELLAGSEDRGQKTEDGTVSAPEGAQALLSSVLSLPSSAYQRGAP